MVQVLIFLVFTQYAIGTFSLIFIDLIFASVIPSGHGRSCTNCSQWDKSSSVSSVVFPPSTISALAWDWWQLLPGVTTTSLSSSFLAATFIVNEWYCGMYEINFQWISSEVKTYYQSIPHWQRQFHHGPLAQAEHHYSQPPLPLILHQSLAQRHSVIILCCRHN